MTISDREIFARTLWGEARGEGFDGMLAAAWVIRNRASNPRWWGHDIRSVCLAPMQFSCWNHNDPNFKLISGEDGPDDAAILAARLAVSAVMDAHTADPTHGADHYHAASITPSWAKGREPVAVIGRHKFYRLELQQPKEKKQCPSALKTCSTSNPFSPSSSPVKKPWWKRFLTGLKKLRTGPKQT